MFDLTLSFDNGPDPATTPAVLDILARRWLRASFFVIGKRLAASGGRAIVERAKAEGHWIGNHTWSHTMPLGVRPEPDAAQQEIGRTQDELGALASSQRYFRPGGGGGKIDQRLFSRSAVEFLTAGGFTCVLWNAIPRDWDDPDGWVETALAQCRAQPWSLMVLHDLPTGAMAHLERFLDAVGEADGTIRQDFPPDCLPIVRGEIVQPIDAYVT
ncbi:MAG: polysaccharide deacetylase [Xanthobacteraceae bacterium]|jgi:peptidoglycan/xylan/chitin deacetylase (PgdA/CDA1 family)|nr:polysaccharide deacetylase [Xanthobacteraceae bacterium]